MKKQEREKFLKIVDEFEKRYDKTTIGYLLSLLDDEGDLDTVLDVLQDGTDDTGVMNVCFNLYDDKHPEEFEDEDNEER